MDETKPNLLLEALDKRWNDYYAELKLCRHETTKEAVHDLRVATRRLISLIELLRAILPHPRLQKLRRSFKSQLDDFEELRDIQVVAVEVSEVLDDLPEAKEFLSHLEKREKRLLRAVGKQVHILKPGNLIKRISAVRKSVVKAADGEEGLDRQLLDTVDDAFALVLHRSELLDPAKPASIHRLRIAFRRFRYLVEIIHPVLPDYPKESLGHLHDFQDSMGIVQDIEILLNHLAEFSEKEPSFNPKPVRRYFQQRHAEVVGIFFKGAPKARSFWRSSRRAAFPWRRRRRAPALPGTADKVENEIIPAKPDQGVEA
jgi:CHAD domain-containing protein